jgi:Zn-dependent protease
VLRQLDELRTRIAPAKARDDARRRTADSLSGEYEEEEEEPKENTTAARAPTVRRPMEAHPDRRPRFSTQEIRDLVIASILVSLVALSIVVGRFYVYKLFPDWSDYWYYPPILDWSLSSTLVIIFVSAFLVHEMAHKFVAQHYGMWSEFRMTSYGYVLSAMAILFSLPVFGTGAVSTSESSSPDEEAKSMLAGPLSNTISASLFMILALIAFYFGRLWYVDYEMILIQNAVIVNCTVGLFSIIPIPPLDGTRILLWRRRVWATLFLLLFTLLALSIVLLPMLRYYHGYPYL